MKLKKIKVELFMVLLITVLISAGCRDSSSHKGVMEAIKAVAPPAQANQFMEQGVPELTEKVESRYQSAHFYTETRKDKMERFRCSSCHDNQDVQIKNAKEMVHGNILLNHDAVDDKRTCFTCHNPENRDYLASKKGEKIDFNHSYQLCGQCHFRQAKDWVGGAHGKRVAKWEGTRVIKNCTGCHNPHSPKFIKRWPTTYSISNEFVSEEH